MRSRIARFLLILTALWLPLQAVAGLTMKIAVPTPAATMQAHEQAEAEACPLHHHDGAHEQTAPQPDSQNGCDRCGVCHLAGTAYMPVTETLAPVLPVPHSFVSLPAIERPSYISEPPQYPPKRA